MVNNITFKEEYSISDICKITRASDKSVRRWINEGLLEGEKASRRWVFSFRQIVDFLSKPQAAEYLATMRRSLLNAHERNPRVDAPRKFVLLDIPNASDKVIHAVIDASLAANALYKNSTSVMLEDGILRIAYYYDGAIVSFRDGEIKESKRMQALLEIIGREL